MNADARIEVVHVQKLEFNAFGSGGSQIIVWEHNPACDIPADWQTNPCGEWNHGMWLDSGGVIVIPAEVQATRTWCDPERRAYQWWADHGHKIEQGGILK
jgi:hypothetical protein